MAYSLQFHDAVRDFFRAHAGLSRQARNSLFTSLHDHLGEHGDTLSDDPTRRVPGAPSCFDLELVIRDSESRVRAFRFVVDDSSKGYGVLKIQFVEELTASS